VCQFVVGTGGNDPYTFQHVAPNSEARYAGWGVLKLTLGPDSYSWEFISTGGAAFGDSGTTPCH